MLSTTTPNKETVMQIPNFPDYRFTDGNVFKISTGKKNNWNIRIQVKIKHKDGLWKQRSKASIKASLGIVNKLSSDFITIPFTCNKYFINKHGEVFGYTKTYPEGRKLKNTINSVGYPRVTIVFKGRKRYVDVHQLMCVTFIMEDYIERGLVCLHRDDNKENIELSNLSIGTYSQNNKDAYSTGVNPIKVQKCSKK